MRDRRTPPIAFDDVPERRPSLAGVPVSSIVRPDPMPLVLGFVLLASFAFAEPLVEASFESDEDAFSYADDVFLGTHAPDQASGARLPAAGRASAMLEVVLGNRDPETVKGLSGGWSRSFALATTTHDVEIMFRYVLTQSSGYERDEFSQLMVGLDGESLPGSGPEFIERITGDGDGGDPTTTGWRQFSMNRGTLDAGIHTLTIGAYNHKKTDRDESTRLLIDDVRVVGEPSPSCRRDADCDDGNPCTADSCTQGLCQHPGSVAICPDGFEYEERGAFR